MKIQTRINNKMITKFCKYVIKPLPKIKFKPILFKKLQNKILTRKSKQKKWLARGGCVDLKYIYIYTPDIKNS